MRAVHLDESAVRLAASALGRWGAERQLRQLQEECAEVIVEVNHLVREREGADKALAEEVADVEIMLAQARKLLGDALVDEMKDRKLRRLAEKLELLEGRRG